jgi:catechol 2,3-dioxygenase-like lactoylglutathione lyase family enzyme
VTIYLHTAAVIVDDQDAALEFYCNVLGWSKGIDNMMGEDFRFLTVVPPGHETGMVLSQPHIAGRPSPGADTPADAGINLVSTDMLAECAQLKERGVVFGQEPEPMPWGGHGATFQDPWGNRFFITDAI